MWLRSCPSPVRRHSGFGNLRPRGSVAMGAYHSLLLPSLLDLAMKYVELRRIRGRLVPLARGRVLEVGCGSGRNLPYYGHRVKELWAIDPSPALLSKAYRRAKDLPFVVEFLERTADTNQRDEQSFDRSEERRVGKEWVRKCSSRGSPYQEKK